MHMTATLLCEASNTLSASFDIWNYPSSSMYINCTALGYNGACDVLNAELVAVLLVALLGL